jgi:serine/threonine protein phosphatase PrpC
MTATDFRITAVAPEPGLRPRDAELDLFGLTHRGKVRRENQDHFLVATVHQQVLIHGTSIPEPEQLPLRGERLATIVLVADGVGGGAAGGEASRLAIESITRYVSSTMRCFHAVEASHEQAFHDALRAATREAHVSVRAEAAARGIESMATTLTLALAVWPWLYVTQVGDSRCYHFRDDTLRQVTRDQTLAQSLVDRGILEPERLAHSPLAHVLSSAIGAAEAAPEVSRLGLSRGSVLLLCTDGLTGHVSNDELEQHIRSMGTSEQLCRTLLDLALDRGGYDNITILAARVRPSH